MIERIFLYEWTSNRIQVFLTGPPEQNFSLSFPPTVGDYILRNVMSLKSDTTDNVKHYSNV